MSSTPSPSSGVGRFTGFVLTLVVILCLALIGFSGYFKYQLDRAEATLAAPDQAVASDQGAFEKLSRALGYSGFVGAAQNFLSTRDHTSLTDMKAHLKDAKDILNWMPDRTPPDARHDLQSIVDIFAAAAQKAEQSTTDPSIGFSSSDLVPLYAALPVIEQRAAGAVASGRYAAQGELKLWATLLMLAAWVGFVIAAACAAGIYLNLRSRQSAPFRALGQSVQNMARGDMRTPIWGMERQDMVGELARSIDLARYHFSQLPDMSLLTEQGPMRIRFEGQARSLFEAMMQNIGRDSETIRAQASTLADAVNQQKEGVTQVSARIEAALKTMHDERQGSEQQVQQLLQTVSGSAQSLRGAQVTAEAQLNHIISYLEERARGMAEVTQIAGRQVAQTLQSLRYTEHNLRTSAEQNQLTVGKLAASTDELGERLFGAVSLLRAGGKVLTETAENTQGRLNEAISLLSQSEGSLRQMLVQGFEPVGNQLLKIAGPGAHGEEADKLQVIVAGLEAAQRKFEECLSQQTASADAMQLVTTQSSSLIAQANATAQALATVTDHLRNEQDKFGETGARFAEALENIGGRLEQRVMESLGRAEITMQGLNRLSELAEQMGTAVERLNNYSPPAQPEISSESIPANIWMEIKTGFEITMRSIERLREEFVSAALRQSAPTSSDAPALAAPDQSGKIIEQIAASNDSLSRAIAQQAEQIETRLAAMDKKIGGGGGGSSSGNVSVAGMSPEEAQSQLQQQAQILSELASALGAIDQHMQEMSASFKGPIQNGGRMAS